MPTLVGNVFPVAEEWIGVGREATTATAVSPTATIPAEKIEPDEKYNFLDDNSIRGMMANLFSATGGTQSAEVAFSGPVYLDTIGHVMLNMFGDYAATGSTPTNSTTLSAPATAGATTCSVTSGTGYAISQAVQIGTGTAAEIVVLTNVSGTTLTFTNTPLRNAHAAAQTVATVVAPFTHVFALLNSSPGQPPTHTITHFNGISGSFKANQYAYWCCASCSLNMDAEKLFTHDTKGMSYIRAAATGAVTNNFSAVAVYPNWRFAVGIGGPASGGTLINDVAMCGIDIKREVKPRWASNGQQAPYVIYRNALSVSGKFTEIAQSDSPMTQLLSNTQPQLQFTATNGLAGANLLSITFDLKQAAMETVKLNNNEIIEYESTWKAINNSTNVGASGGAGPMVVTIVNAVPTY
jgi:hypothetical protein